jgi:hypothetical protein
MTLRTVVRNTRGLAVGDTVARLLPDGEADSRAFVIHEMTPGYLAYQGEDHFVYLLIGVAAPFGKKIVKMVATENVPWCVARGGDAQ